MITNKTSFSEFTHELTQKISSCDSNTYKSGFGDYELFNLTDEDKTEICNLLLNNVWIFDYIPYSKTTDSDGTESYTRTNLSAFVNKYAVHNIAKELSKQNVIVCVQNHITTVSELYRGGRQVSFEDYDFRTKFKLCFNDYGNPLIEKIEHVWDYGSDIELLKPILNESLFGYINENYVEVSIINGSFSLDSILKNLNDIINKI